MTNPATPRWLMSFADLCLVLLGLFIVLYASAADPAKVSASFREALGEKTPDGAVQRFAATRLFEPGEAVLRPRARILLEALGRRAGSGSIRLASHGTTTGSARLDGWELAAARTGAVARALRTGGLPERRIAIALMPGEGAQEIEVSLVKK